MTFSLDPFCHGNPISFFLFLFLAIIVLAIKIYDIRMKSRFFEAGWFQFSQCRRFVKIVGKNYRHCSVWLVKWTVRFQVRITGKFQKKTEYSRNRDSICNQTSLILTKQQTRGGGVTQYIFIRRGTAPRSYPLPFHILFFTKKVLL